MSNIAGLPLDALLTAHPCIKDFIASIGLPTPTGQQALSTWLSQLSDEDIFDAGMSREQMLAHIQRLMNTLETMEAAGEPQVGSLTIVGGRNKQGEPENIRLTVRAGEVICIVGPTGSGKSRLLGDIECLAQGDTPTQRYILIDDVIPDDDFRFALERKLIAQLSQNMNFVVDLSVWDFIGMHAHCRNIENPEHMIAEVIDCANQLTGEQFAADISVTQLSGGQTRALMIADAALLSASPIVLIDEIENAGVDRKQALELLVSNEKIVFISTHDPMLALRGSRRIVVRNGGVVEIIETSALERKNLARIEAIDTTMMSIRDRLRRGLRIEEDIIWPN